MFVSVLLVVACSMMERRYFAMGQCKQSALTIIFNKDYGQFESSFERFVLTYRVLKKSDLYFKIAGRIIPKRNTLEDRFSWGKSSKSFKYGQILSDLFVIYISKVSA